ncbi:lipoprotein NlpI [Avibacterium paragallinarum]|uniref:Lipoprotein NlpI n=1 Tax=Avibacterium paragallinarum TaxID=728 RepID=A0A380X0X6_AVIPA|nr:Lipoprotein NlpI homolog precursor [Avibacterium paragallinarum]
MQHNRQWKSLWCLSMWRLILLPLAFLFSGCGGSQPAFMVDHQLAIAEQTPVLHSEQETMIARISQILQVGHLNEKKLTNKERAVLHFERGILYDNLGLWTLARYDFLQALELQPRVTALYNYLGVSLLLSEDYDNALEAFNIALTLNPKDANSLFNRGIDFYYMGRYTLAEKDLSEFYQVDTSDPYRALWLYLNELEINPENAKQQLKQRSLALADDKWGSYIVQYYLGQLSVAELQQKGITFAKEHAIPYAEILTETYFYLAKQQLNLGQKEQAETLFKLAIANQVYNFVEYRFAVLELAKLKQAKVQ